MVAKCAIVGFVRLLEDKVFVGESQPSQIRHGAVVMRGCAMSVPDRMRVVFDKETVTLQFLSSAGLHDPQSAAICSVQDAWE